MSCTPDRGLSRVPGGVPSAQVLTLAVAVSLVGAIAAIQPSTPLLLGFVAAVVLGSVFILTGAEPFLPYLILVAAIQAGTLLRLPQLGLISSALPLLGGWVLLAFLMSGSRPKTLDVQGTAMQRKGLQTTSVALVAFFALAFATTLAQTWRMDARPWTIGELLTLAQLAVLVLVTAALVHSPNRMLLVAKVTIVAGCLASLLAVGSQFGVVYLPILSQDMVREGVTRVSGTVLDPNIFSFQLLVPLAFALNLVFASGSTTRLLMWAGACVILGAGVASTYSAGAIVGVGAAVLISVLLRMRTSLRAGIVAVIVVALLTLGVSATLPQGYVDVVAAKYSRISSGNVSSLGTGRGAAWEAAGRALAASPILGSGLSSEYVQTAVAKTYTEEQVEFKAAHNTYLAIGVATGLAGLALFVAAFFSALLMLWRRYNMALPPNEPGAVNQYQTAIACLLTALLVIMFQALQLDLQMEKYVWLALGAAVAAARWRPA